MLECWSVWAILWSLLLGAVPIHIGDRTPPILVFDFVLMAWIVKALLAKKLTFPDLSDSAILKLAFAYFLISLCSALANLNDPLKSLMSIKIFCFGMLVYIAARSSEPELWVFSGFGALTGLLLICNFLLYFRDVSENIANLKYSVETPLGGSNYVAALLAMTLPLSVAGACITRKWTRAFHGLAASISFVGLAISASRGIWLALILCTLVSLPLLFRAGLRMKHLVLASAVLLIFVIALPGELLALNITLIQDRIANPDLDRLDIWRLCFDKSLENPILGVGPGQVVNYVAHLNIQSGRLNAHNLILNSTMDVGLLGTIPFLWMLWTILSRAFKWAKCNPSPLALAVWLSIFIALTSDFVEGSFPGQQFQVLFWMIAALIPLSKA